MSQREQKELSKSHIEFEDSEEESGDTVVQGSFAVGRKTKMPTDGLSSSISGFLRKTDHFSQEYKTAVREREMSIGRDMSGIDKVSPYTGGDFRATSVARASSVSRQFDSPSSLVRGGSVSRGFEMSTSRDPFYSAISSSAVSSSRYRLVPVHMSVKIIVLCINIAAVVTFV